MYKKGNLGWVHSSNKRPKVNDSAMVGVGSRIRQPLLNSNAGASLVDPNPGTDSNTIEFISREDVERLLNEKVKGKNKNDYKAAIRYYKKEQETRTDIEKSRDAMSEELLKAGQEAIRLKDQIKVLEANNKRLQEYNSSLQQYNCSPQTEAAKNGEMISKMNEEKNSLIGTLTSLRNNTTSMKTQLDTYRNTADEKNQRSQARRM